MNETSVIYILKAQMVSSSLHVDSLKNKSKNIFFDGHFPLIDYENKITEKLCSPEADNTIMFCQSLEDLLFKQFGSENIISLLEKLGLDENESLTHPMINKAIERAREKISSGGLSETRALNENEWFTINVKK